jgi:biotin carboxylase
VAARAAPTEPRLRLLLLVSSTSYRAGAFLAAARALGIAVTVGTDRRQALAELNPDGHLTLDFGDVGASVRAIAAHAHAAPLHAILAADDDGAVLAAEAAAVLGLTHAAPAAVRAARDKHEMRVALGAAGIPGPFFERVPLDADPEAIAPRMPYPCVLKPLALAGSRGVILARSPEEFPTAFRRLRTLLARPDAADPGGRPAQALLVEGYIVGAEVAVEGLLTGGSLRVLAIFDKPDPLEGPFFEETIYVTPSRLPAADQREAEATTAEMCAALGLAEGPVHAELRVCDGVAAVVEIAPRSIGGLCSRALRFAGGRSLEELILLHALGRPGTDAALDPTASGVMMIPIPRAGLLVAVRGEEAARAVPGIEELRITAALGHRIEPLPEGARYLGFLFARRDTPAEVETALREAHRKLEIVLGGA